MLSNANPAAVVLYSGSPPCGHPWNKNMHCNADTACSPGSILHILNNPWNKDTPLISTLWVGPKGVCNRGVPLCIYSLFFLFTFSCPTLDILLQFHYLYCTFIYSMKQLYNCIQTSNSWWFLNQFCIPAFHLAAVVQNNISYIYIIYTLPSKSFPWNTL